MIQRRLGPPPLTAAQFDACRPYLRLSARVLAAAENVLVWNATQSSIARHLGLHRQAVHRACVTVQKVSRKVEALRQNC